MEICFTCILVWQSSCICLKTLKHGHFIHLHFGVAVLVYLDKAVDDFAYLQFRVAILVYLTEDVEDLAHLQFGLAVWLTWLRRR